MLKVLVVLILAAAAFCLVCLLGVTAARAGTPVVEIKDLDINTLTVDGFELTAKSGVDINIVGAGVERAKQLFAYGWIIDAADRDLVWSMQKDCYDLTHVGDAILECQESITLRPGRYEVYYYVAEPSTAALSISIGDLGDLIDFVGDVITFDDEKWDRFYDEDVEELTMVITTDEPASRYTPVFDAPEGSIVFFNQPVSDELLTQGFSLARELELEVYAIGEYSESYDLFVDGAWIVDADSRDQVWTMDKWNTDRAGGAGKNRFIKETITLPAGNYIAHYATDDSHSPGEWNAPPPYDPMNYGLSIAVADPADRQYVSAFDETMNEVEIVRLVRVRDGTIEKAGFTLHDDARIHVYGLGERDYSDDRLVDYGWITDAENIERVWEMTAENTGFGGGAAKNCVFDGVIDLPAGNYVVYYRTDDSHAYGDWNAAPPYDKRSWGISLYGLGPNFTKKSFTLVDEFEPLGNVLVDLTGMGNDEDSDRSFTLAETCRVRVMALGEGKGGRMYDYGWIENDRTGEIVWEMTYRKTRHAGGADKNRMVVANLTLEAGTYTAYFVTDGSHSLERFNASPPDNPERWGMLVTLR